MVIATLGMFALNACVFYKPDGIEIKINNSSSQTITEVRFTTTEEFKVILIDSIVPGETVTKFLSMRENETDESYVLSFRDPNGEWQRRNAGYYTNGSSLDYWVYITVEQDTTRIRFDAPIF